MQALTDCQDLFFVFGVDPTTPETDACFAVLCQQQLDGCRGNPLATVDLDRDELASIDQLINPLPGHLQRITSERYGHQGTVNGRLLQIPPQDPSVRRFALDYREQFPLLLTGDVHGCSVAKYCQNVKRKKAADAPTPDTLLITPTA
jgi:hypothetical protein